MAPTIQNGNNPASSSEIRPQRPIEKKSELISRVKYSNTLPDIPFDLKYITYPFATDRFVQYNPTSLERNYKYEVLTEHDLGVTIDLINRDLYQSDPMSNLDPADEKLLEEEMHTPQDSQRSRHHAKSVSWLRKSEYISTEQTRFQPQNNEKVEAKVGFNVRKSFVEETLYMDREAQIKSIEKTFDDIQELKTGARHYSKPNVTALEVLPVYPDFKNWKYPCAQVIFDSDPAPANSTKHITAQMEEMSQAMIRGVMDESGEQFVAYFLPTEETMEKRRLDLINETLYVDDQEYEYKMAREYNWNVKSKATKGYEENYFLVMRQDGVYYDELETRVRLNKRRQNIGQQPNNTKLVVKHIPLNEVEHRMQRYRERQLEPPCEEEEFEEIEEHEEPDQPMESEKVTDNSQKDTDADKGSDGEDKGKGDGNESDGSRKTGRTSRSRSRSVSRTPSRSRSRSRSRSHSRSHSRSRSRSGSRSGSAASNRSGSGRSRSGSRSRSHSRSRSRTPASHRSGSAKSGSRSRSGSATSHQSGSGRSRSHSRTSRSRSRTSRSRSHSGTARSHSGSGSERSRSASRTPAKTGSGSGSGSDSE